MPGQSATVRDPSRPGPQDAVMLGAEQVFPDESSGSGDAEDMLTAVAQISETLTRHAQQSEAEGQLAAPVVDALRSHGLWRMRLCRELGGAELSIIDQVRVLSALAAVDTSSAWCTMVANNAVAILGATMPSETVAQVFAVGVPACSIVAAPSGRARPTDNGYTLSGTWRLASAVRHAEWIHASTFVDGDPSRPMAVALPARDVEVLDSWNVIGLRGTGSNDFSLTDYPLPAALAGPVGGARTQLRGQRRYDRVDLEGMESYEHLAFALGVARRALDELSATLARPGRQRTADREVVQRELGQALVTLRAIEATAHSIYTQVDAATTGREQSWPATDRRLPRALGVWATGRALQCVELAFHRAGAASLQRPNILEKLLRDMNVAASHVMVDDTALCSYAREFIESAGAASATGESGRHAH